MRGTLTGLVLSLLLLALAAFATGKRPPNPILPEGITESREAVRGISGSNLEAGDLVFLEGRNFLDQRIELDLLVSEGGVCEIFFHRTANDIQVLSDYGMIGRKAYSWYALRVSTRPDLPCAIVKSSGLNERGQEFVIAADQWVHVSLLSRDGTQVAKIDDVEVDRLSDRDYPWGETGIVPIEGSVSIKNLHVVPLAAGPRFDTDTVRANWAITSAILLAWLAMCALVAPAEVRMVALHRATAMAIVASACFAALTWFAALRDGGPWGVAIGALLATALAFLHQGAQFRHNRWRGAVTLFHLGLVLVALEGVARNTALGERWAPDYTGGYVKDRFLFWQMEPGSRVWESYINSFGFRGREMERTKADDTYRVICLGSSSTYGDGIARSEDAYPAVLEDLLLAGRGGNVEVLNAGVSGYTTFQALQTLRRELLPLEPDLVTINIAHNDKVPSEVGVPYRDHWKRMNERRNDSLEAARNRLQRWHLYNGLVSVLRPPENTVDASLEQTRISDDPGDSRPSRVPHDHYRENLEAFDALADSVGFDIVYILEPEYDFFYPRPFFEDYYDIMRDVAHRLERPLVDTILAFRERRFDTLFYDDVHLNEWGARVMARTIYETLRATSGPDAQLAPIESAWAKFETARQDRHRAQRKLTVGTPTLPTQSSTPRQGTRERPTYLQAFTEFYLDFGTGFQDPDSLDRAVRRSLERKDIELNTRLGVVAMNLARGGLARAMGEDAIPPLQEAASADPDIPAIYVALANEHRAAARWDEARDALTNAAELAPNDPRIQRELARGELRRGEWDAALALARHAVALGPQNPASLSLLAECQRQSGLLNEAKTTFRRLLEIAPDSPEAARARGFIDS